MPQAALEVIIDSMRPISCVPGTDIIRQVWGCGCTLSLSDPVHGPLSSSSSASSLAVMCRQMSCLVAYVAEFSALQDSLQLRLEPGWCQNFNSGTLRPMLQTSKKLSGPRITNKAKYALFENGHSDYRRSHCGLQSRCHCALVCSSLASVAGLINVKQTTKRSSVLLY